MKINNNMKHADFSILGDIMEAKLSRNFENTYKDKANIHNKEAMIQMFKNLKKKGVYIPTREELTENDIDQMELYVKIQNKENNGEC